MVVKTEVCSYSGFRIYPGHGIAFARNDAKVVPRRRPLLYLQPRGAMDSASDF